MCTCVQTILRVKRIQLNYFLIKQVTFSYIKMTGCGLKRAITLSALYWIQDLVIRKDLDHLQLQLQQHHTLQLQDN